MRARNLKPGFFQNEQLAELPVEARLVFLGLTLIADRDGRLEDRPKRIKMQVFPADLIDVEPLLAGLADQGLIVRYEVEGNAYIWIPTFTKHQKPHPREAASAIPPYQGEDKATPRHDLGSTKELSSPAESLNPESLNPKISAEPPAAAPVIPLKDGTDYHPPEDILAQWKTAYPNVMVAEQLLRIAAWNRSNPGKRKTRRGVTKHINEWLSRADKEAAKEAKANGSESPAMSRSNPFHPDNML